MYWPRLCSALGATLPPSPTPSGEVGGESSFRKEPRSFLELECSLGADWRPLAPSPASWLLHGAQASGPGLTEAQLPWGLSRAAGEEQL